MHWHTFGVVNAMMLWRDGTHVPQGLRKDWNMWIAL